MIGIGFFDFFKHREVSTLGDPIQTHLLEYGFPKIRGTFWGFPRIRNIVY